MKKPNYLEFISLDFFTVAGKLADKIGVSVYVVGGFVRDKILNRPHKKDIDFVVLGDAPFFAKSLSNELKIKTPIKIFKTYGTAMFRYGDWELEFVGARKESYTSESRNPTISKGTLKDDQNRRDFTMNALAISLNKKDFGALIDPFEGMQALREKKIMTPLDPDKTFSDDPLRMMRAIRFLSELHFDIAPETLAAIKQNHQRIRIITKERIVSEFHKIMMSEKPSKGIMILEQTGLLGEFLPELTALKGIEEREGQRHKDNFFHTLQVVDNISKKTAKLWLRWAALLHDIGKAPTKKFSKKNGWTFHHHEFIGAKMAYEIFKRLRLPLNNDMKFVQKMIVLSSRPIILATEVTDSAVRRLIFDAGVYIDDLMMLCEADITTKNKTRFKKYLNNFTKVREKINAVEKRDQLRNFQPPISGEVIMKTFGIKPSPDIGIIKEKIKDAILEGQIPNEYDPAYKLMLTIGQNKGFIVKQC